MNRIILVISMMVICFGFLVGCKTTVSDVDAYKLGRLTAVAYLSQKDRLSEKDLRVVQAVYKEFDALVTNSGTMPGNAFKQELLKALAEKAHLKPEELLLATEVVDIYWNKLGTYYKIDALIDSQYLTVLQDFNKGVKDALNDYDFLSPASKSSK